MKTKGLVFRRANVYLDTVPAQLDNVERLEYVKLFDVFIDSKLSFCEHVERLLCAKNQRLYLLSRTRKQGLSDKCSGVVYDAIVLNKMLHAFAGWGGYISQSLDLFDASFRKTYVN